MRPALDAEPTRWWRNSTMIDRRNPGVFDEAGRLMSILDAAAPCLRYGGAMPGHSLDSRPGCASKQSSFLGPRPLRLAAKNERFNEVAVAVPVQ
jgi:hypothetical protein